MGSLQERTREMRRKRRIRTTEIEQKYVKNTKKREKIVQQEEKWCVEWIIWRLRMKCIIFVLRTCDCFGTNMGLQKDVAIRHYIPA